jgi:SAM-dependent methyltransferase
VPTEYTETFYDSQRAGSRRSADRIVPLLLEIKPTKSVLDVGCGVGTWLAAFRSNGVTDVLGIDGEYVDRDALEIPQELFRAHDLTQHLSCDRRFDLAISLEVGEHLPSRSAETLVASLTGASDLVAFSAAIPNQGGTAHINEQWQSWWAELFREHGYVARDVIRPRVWADSEIETFYRQNLVVYVSASLAPHVSDDGARPLDIVHPDHLRYVEANRVRPPVTLRTLPREAITSIRDAFTRRVR